MININTLKRNVHYLANKSQTGASISPDEFNLEIPLAVYFVLRRILGLPEEYQPQIPLTQMGYEKTQWITEYVDALKVSNVSLNVTSKGKATLPTDYFYIADLYSYQQQLGTIPSDDVLLDPDVEKIQGYCAEDDCECTDGITTPINLNAGVQQTLKTLKMRVPVEIVDSNTFTSRQQHSIRIPDLSYPIAAFSGNKSLELCPQNINRVFITYLKRPVTPVWGYTIDPTTLQAVYDPLTSVNIDLPEELTDMVTACMLVKLGYSVRETELQQIGTKINATGS